MSSLSLSQPTSFSSYSPPPPIPILLRRGRVAGWASGSWSRSPHPTWALFLLTNPTVWAEGSFLHCKEDLSKAGRYQKAQPKGNRPLWYSWSSWSLGKRVPWPEAIAFFNFTLCLPSLIHVKARPFAGIWPIILGKFLKAVEEHAVR